MKRSQPWDSSVGLGLETNMSWPWDPVTGLGLRPHWSWPETPGARVLAWDTQRAGLGLRPCWSRPKTSRWLAAGEPAGCRSWDWWPSLHLASSRPSSHGRGLVLCRGSDNGCRCHPCSFLIEEEEDGPLLGLSVFKSFGIFLKLF